MSVCLSVWISIYPIIHLFIYPFIHLYNYPSINHSYNLSKKSEIHIRYPIFKLGEEYQKVGHTC